MTQASLSNLSIEDIERTIEIKWKEIRQLLKEMKHRRQVSDTNQLTLGL